MKYVYILASILMLATTSVFAADPGSAKGCLYPTASSKPTTYQGRALVCCATPDSTVGASRTQTHEVPITTPAQCPATSSCSSIAGGDYIPSALCNQDLSALLRKHPGFDQAGGVYGETFK